MTGTERLFFDTAPFIYWLENHPEFYPKVVGLVTEALEHDTQFITSVLSFSEFCVKPHEQERFDLIDDFKKLVEDLNCPMLAITLEIATKAYQLRAKYTALKGIDSLQVAAAIQSGCQKFITNDKRLKQVAEIEIVVIAEL